MSNELMTIKQGAPQMMKPLNQGTPNALAMMGQAREAMEAVASMQVAKAFPRDLIGAREMILNACTSPKLAERAVYQYAKGGSEVTGPSIRLAEMIAQNWGNIDFGIRELEQKPGESICEAYCWDKQTNTRQVKIFHVSHIRHTRQGDKLLTDPREIYEMVANNGARRLRACILGVIPADIVDEAVEACDQTLKTKFKNNPDTIKMLLDKFKNYGITQAQIEKRIQCRIEAIKPAQIAQLVKIGVSIRDGMSKAEDWFEPEEKANAQNAAKKSAKTLRDAIGINTHPNDAEGVAPPQNA